MVKNFILHTFPLKINVELNGSHLGSKLIYKIIKNTLISSLKIKYASLGEVVRVCSLSE